MSTFSSCNSNTNDDNSHGYIGYPISTTKTSIHLPIHQQQHGNSIKSGPTKPKSKPRRRVATVAQRRAANIRERRRMFNLNSAFDKLRKKVPTFAYEKRLSRIETLRLAIMYISFMSDLLDTTSIASDMTTIEPPQQQQQQLSPSLTMTNRSMKILKSKMEKANRIKSSSIVDDERSNDNEMMEEEQEMNPIKSSTSMKTLKSSFTLMNETNENQIPTTIVVDNLSPPSTTTTTFHNPNPPSIPQSSSYTINENIYYPGHHHHHHQFLMERYPSTSSTSSLWTANNNHDHHYGNHHHHHHFGSNSSGHNDLASSSSSSSFGHHNNHYHTPSTATTTIRYC